MHCDSIETMTDTSAATDWRFFRWMRGMDVPRRAGWIGGVCAGIADRIRIDPIIVRGIAVVLAVLGAPALLLYAAAWLLLPDAEDRIHLERLLRGRFDPAVVGAGVMLLLQLTPLTAGFWFLGYSYWSEPYGGAGWFFRVLWTGFMLTAVVLFILWMARRARTAEQRAAYTAGTGADGGPASAAWVASSTGTVVEGPQASDAGGAPGAPGGFPAPAAGGSSTSSEAGSTASSDAATGAAPAPDAAPASAAPPQPGEPVAPAPPAADAPAEQLAAWRQQQESWKLHHAAWTAQQRQGVDARIRSELAAQRAVEREQRHAAWREAQRRRRLANPRIGFALTVLVIGAALIAAAAVVLGVRQAGMPEMSVAAGFATASAVFGVAMIVAGAARRRSGFLSFLAATSLIVAGAGSLVPADRALLGANASLDLRESGRYSQPLGSTYLYWHSPSVDATGEVLDLVDGQPSTEGAVHVPGSLGTETIDLWQAAGTVSVNLPPNVVVQLDLDAGPDTVVSSSTFPREGGDTVYESIAVTDGRIVGTFGEGDGVDVVITGWVGASRVDISRQIPVDSNDGTPTEEVQP